MNPEPIEYYRKLPECHCSVGEQIWFFTFRQRMQCANSDLKESVKEANEAAMAFISVFHPIVKVEQI